MANSSIILALFCGLLSLYTVLAGTNAEGLAYLDAKGKEEGVVTLPSGLLYKEIRAGNADGKTPTANSPCECDYAGTLIDGTEFDSSYKRGKPATFAPNQVIKGWTQAMQLMKEGAKWELYIPSELAYGDRGSGSSIPGGSVLVFTLELLKVNGDFVMLESDMDTVTNTSEESDMDTVLNTSEESDTNTVTNTSEESDTNTVTNTSEESIEVPDEIKSIAADIKSGASSFCRVDTLPLVLVTFIAGIMV